MLIPAIIYAVGVFTIIGLALDYKDLKTASKQDNKNRIKRLDKIIEMIETKLGGK